jgi:hypothetical protein
MNTIEMDLYFTKLAARRIIQKAEAKEVSMHYARSTPAIIGDVMAPKVVASAAASALVFLNDSYRTVSAGLFVEETATL